MATRKIFVSSTALVIFVLIIPYNVVNGGQSLYSEDWNCIQETFYNKRLVARDVILQTIHDIQNLEKSISAIPLLKSFQETTGRLSELNDCVAGLVGQITVARQTLFRIRPLNDKTMPYVQTNLKSLQNIMNETLKVQGQVCLMALKDIDRTITSMLGRKLLNVAVTIDDIVHLVYKL